MSAIQSHEGECVQMQAGAPGHATKLSSELLNRRIGCFPRGRRMPLGQDIDEGVISKATSCYGFRPTIATVERIRQTLIRTD
jgi:hypothetical protein